MRGDRGTRGKLNYDNQMLVGVSKQAEVNDRWEGRESNEGKNRKVEPKVVT